MDLGRIARSAFADGLIFTTGSPRAVLMGFDVITINELPLKVWLVSLHLETLSHLAPADQTMSRL